MAVDTILISEEEEEEAADKQVMGEMEEIVQLIQEVTVCNQAVLQELVVAYQVAMVAKERDLQTHHVV